MKAMTLALALFWPTPLLAFDIFVPPVTTADPGFLFPNSPSDLDPYAGEHAASPLHCDVGAIPKAKIAALNAGYTDQLAINGEAAARQWLDTAIDEQFQILAQQGLCTGTP